MIGGEAVAPLCVVTASAKTAHVYASRCLVLEHHRLVMGGAPRALRRQPY